MFFHIFTYLENINFCFHDILLFHHRILILYLSILIKKIIVKTKKNNGFLHLKLVIILLYIYLLLYILTKKISYKIKVCICTIGKKENLYIREYIKYYKNLGIDKIYIYDNNEINGETFENVIFDYIKINYVNIINYRGYLKPQSKMMNTCYKMNYLKYDWIIFNDIDEFLYLKNYSNIKNFLKNLNLIIVKLYI